MFIMHVGLTLADLVLRDRAELDRLQIPALELDVGDNALPQDRLVEQRIGRRYLKNKIAELEEDRLPVVNLLAVQQGSPVHYDDIRARVDLRVRPFLQPFRRSEPLRQLFQHDGLEGLGDCLLYTSPSPR